MTKDEEIASLRKTLEHWQLVANQGIHIERELRHKIMTVRQMNRDQLLEILEEEIIGDGQGYPSQQERENAADRILRNHVIISKTEYEQINN